MLRDVQRLLLQAMLDDDPPAHLARALQSAPQLSEAEREQLAHVSADGLRLSGLLVKKLRFERLTGGDKELSRLFDENPQEFMRLYRAYTAAVDPEVYFPEQEARLFREWMDRVRRG